MPRWRFLAIFCVLYFSESLAALFKPASLIRTKATQCAEVRQACNLRRLRLGEEKRKIEGTTVKCGPMPNVMAALPNIGGDVCSTPQSLANAHY